MAARQFFFATEREADAFVEGVYYVNDSAITVTGLTDTDDGSAKPWRVERVDLEDADASEPEDESVLTLDDCAIGPDDADIVIREDVLSEMFGDLP